jgi:hypothetical protein
MIAEPEKALLDTIYLRGYVPPELNLDLLDLQKLVRYAERFPRKTKISIKSLRLL